MKKFILITALWACYACVYSQALVQGAKVPDLTINTILNNNINANSVSDLYRGKVLILDFWATWCGACISEFSLLDSLQKKYTDQLRIIPVTYESSELVKDFLKKRPSLQTKEFPLIVSDTAMRKLFPHKYLPHIVWISGNGTFLAATDAEEVTEANIEKVVSGKLPMFRLKTDDLTFNFFKPLSVPDTAIYFRSSLQRYNKNVGSGYLALPGPMSFDSVKRFFGWNASILQLYWLAFSGFRSMDINFKRIIMSREDSLKYSWPSVSRELLESWKDDYVYSYELIMPSNTQRKIFYNFMFQELNRLFKLKAKIITKLSDVYVLRKEGKAIISMKPLKGREPHMIYEGNLLKRIDNLPFKELMTFLWRSERNNIFIDETGIVEDVDLVLNLRASEQDVAIEKLISTLKPYGISVTKEVRNVEFLVLKEGE